MNRMVKFLTWSLALHEPFKNIFLFGSMFSYVGLNASYLLVLGLILTQYIAITFPHRYSAIVTTPRVLACICTSCVYFNGLFCYSLLESRFKPFLRVDLHLHCTLITLLLISGSAMLLRTFRKFAKTSWQLGGGARQTRTNRRSEKQLSIAALLLSNILIVCAIPHIISIHLILYAEIETLQDISDTLGYRLVCHFFVLTTFGCLL